MEAHPERTGTKHTRALKPRVVACSWREEMEGLLRTERERERKAWSEARARGPLALRKI